MVYISISATASILKILSVELPTVSQGLFQGATKSIIGRWWQSGQTFLTSAMGTAAAARVCHKDKSSAWARFRFWREKENRAGVFGSMKPKYVCKAVNLTEIGWLVCRPKTDDKNLLRGYVEELLICETKGLQRKSKAYSWSSCLCFLCIFCFVLGNDLGNDFLISRSKRTRIQDSCDDSCTYYRAYFFFNYYIIVSVEPKSPSQA